VPVGNVAQALSVDKASAAQAAARRFMAVDARRPL
jgi:hypothetical protein